MEKRKVYLFVGYIHSFLVFYLQLSGTNLEKYKNKNFDIYTQVYA